MFAIITMHIACCTIVQFVVVCCHRQSCALLFLSLYQFDTICDFHSFDGAWHPPQWSIKMCAAKIVFTMLACWFPSRVLETWHRNEKKNEWKIHLIARHLPGTKFHILKWVVQPFFWAGLYFMEDLSILSPNFKHLPYLYLPSAISGTRWDCIYLVNQKLFNGKL